MPILRVLDEPIEAMHLKATLNPTINRLMPFVAIYAGPSPRPPPKILAKSHVTIDPSTEHLLAMGPERIFERPHSPSRNMVSNIFCFLFYFLLLLLFACIN